MTPKDPFRPLDDDARAMIAELMTSSHAALAVTREDGTPSVTRISLAADKDSAPVTLISDLSLHTKALRNAPACALLIGEPGEKGDPLTHPRLTLHCKAAFVEQGSAAHVALRAHYLAQRPKAKLYVDFADFHFVRFEVVDGLLNAGFGKAYKIP
ncbi:HugZ family pyridoxamine 5'-phosphate oxidase [Cognatishimia activa]|uniref:Heme utilization protein HutZ n=1 Tax=Cognatishimia activa TaxID=1715691 RepID=A0A0P1IRR6_9RHOB|nr:pyridoxamine 5'-phosphate oxidase family protein [Cognatishimia activa]CUI61078.1 heme utilization protein HutZ [Cognatishimia activa]CUK26287.1 heme utilization protein HutZ [Cognatishimia activa]